MRLDGIHGLGLVLVLILVCSNDFYEMGRGWLLREKQRPKTLYLCVHHITAHLSIQSLHKERKHIHGSLDTSGGSLGIYLWDIYVSME